MLSVVILAGGKGERFWPASRQGRPKQFLPLTGQQVMLQRTVERVTPAIVGLERVYVVTGQEYVPLVQEALPNLPTANILAEPVGRNTAPGIGWAATHLARCWGEQSVMAVLPADHHITGENEFRAVLKAAVQRASESDELITLGIKPERAETGYGYIEKGDFLAQVQGYPCYSVRRFVEKPHEARAKELVAAGTYEWNSGMFIWRVAAIQAAIARHLPELAYGLQQIKPLAEDGGASLQEVYPRLSAISIDYGVMEKAERVSVFPVAMGWDDVGSWPALMRLHPADNQGNVTLGKNVAVRSHDCLIVNQTEGLITALGVDDLVIVASEGAIMVCRRAEAQNVRQLVNELHRQGFEDFT